MRHASATKLTSRWVADFVQRTIKCPTAGSFAGGGLMQSSFSVGQFVRFRKVTGRIYEIIRILPLEDGGTTLYVIRSTHGAEAVARHSEIERA
jgi:hypothetical protein